MCGILFTNNPEIKQERFRESLGLMRHRGPDTNPGYYAYKGYKLGHTRLKILDLDDRSNQPFFSQDKRYVIIYNGEVYNFKELASQYDLQPQTTGDTEILLSLYTKMGQKMLLLLNGMFTFVILDTLNDEVFIARDRLGIKPLYIAEKSGYFTVASEIASIIEFEESRKFDDVGIRQYLKLRTFFNNRTIYSNIKMFPAGHFMFKGRMQQYWSLSDKKQELLEDEELHDLIKSSVDYRCISDVCVGSYLSGGLDSTIVAGLASKPHTWTIGFADNNEFQWGRLASKKFNSLHSEVLIDKEEFVGLAKMMIKRRQEPLSVPNEVLLCKMTKEVKKYNTVVLSGEGADELFFGYDRIFRWAHANNWDIKEFSRLYSYGSHEDIEIIEDAVSAFLHYGKAIDIVASFFQIAHLHGLLRRLDNATMFSSVEARVPFVDHRLIERMAGVSFEYRMKNGIVKEPLKRIFKTLVPQEIIEREKIGFPVDLDALPLGKTEQASGIDRWFEFNLKELGYSK